MTLRQILDFARQRLDDRAEPYRWDDDTLVLYINEAERESCRRAHLIIDKTTASICRMTVLAGSPDMALSPLVLSVRACYLGPYVRGTLSWDSTTNTLLNTLNTFVTAGFKVGDQFEVKGFTGTTNNGSFTVASVVAGAIVVEETGITTTETSLIATAEEQRTELIKVTTFELDDLMQGWNTHVGTSTHFVQEEDNSLRLVSIPEEPNTLHLTVSRLPLADMALTTNGSPEIPSMYHYDLIDWVCHLAKLTDDQDSADFKTADMYDRNFTGKFGPRHSARYEQFKKQYPRERSIRPRSFG